MIGVLMNIDKSFRIMHIFKLQRGLHLFFKKEEEVSAGTDVKVTL